MYIYTYITYIYIYIYIEREREIMPLRSKRAVAPGSEPLAWNCLRVASRVDRTAAVSQS